MITNPQRAANGETVIRAIKDRDDADMETLITDALADMMHLCERDQVDFLQCLSVAFQHYCEESDGYWPNAHNTQNRK